MSNPLCYCIFPFNLRVESASVFPSPLSALPSLLPLPPPLLLHLQVWSDSSLRHWAWRDVILIEADRQRRRRYTPAQEFNALPRSRRIDPNFVFLVFPSAASSILYLHLFYSTSIRTMLLLVAGTTPWPQKLCPRLIYIVSISVESCTHCLLIEFFQSSGCVRRVLNHTAVLLCRRVQLNNLLIYADDINLCKLNSISACYPLVSFACLKSLRFKIRETIYYFIWVWNLFPYCKVKLARSVL